MKFVCAGENFNTDDMEAVPTRHPGLCLYITHDRKRVFVQMMEAGVGVTFHEANGTEIRHLRRTYGIKELDGMGERNGK